MPKTGLTTQEWKVSAGGSQPSPPCQNSSSSSQRKSNLSQPTTLALKADEPPLPLQSASATVGSAVAVPATAPAAAPAAIPTPVGMHTAHGETRTSPTSTQGTSGLPVDTPELARTSLFPRQQPDYAHQIPDGWRANIAPHDQAWIGKHVFVAKGVPSDSSRHWFHAPEIRGSKKPVAGEYFLRPMYLWMPRKNHMFDFKCSRCQHSLRSKGLYNRVRLVLDIKSFYYLATEYMGCGNCGSTFIAYDHRMLEQLPYALKSKFPAVLTYKYACDKSVLSMLRSRRVGNSPTALQALLHELHTETWLTRQAEYLHDCISYRKGVMSHSALSSNFEPVEAFKSLPPASWFLAAYARDVWSRRESLKASLSSVFGSILKIDATKKTCRKLAGNDANSANCVLNVGNERGEIVQCVVTSSESLSSLQPMADGLMDRYAAASVEPPVVIYTDRDCCSASGLSKYQQLFNRWSSVEIRLDIWHFMRRLASGCCTESHSLYSTFMSRISRCIFEWDSDDVDKLKQAKRGELVAAGLAEPHDRHSGVPLFNDKIAHIWACEKKHIACLQDVPDLPLYAVKDHVIKGGIRLPVFRCARGTTSLESFHRHLATFIPGFSANAVNFQAYLLDGVTRWNVLRKEAADGTTPIASFDTELVMQVDVLHRTVFKKPLTDRDPPSQATQEDFGMEFLYKQGNRSLVSEDIDRLVEDVSGDTQDDEDTGLSFWGKDSLPVDLPGLLGTATTSEDESDDVAGDGVNDQSKQLPTTSDAAEVEPEISVDSRGIPGWDKVNHLAKFLVGMTGISVSRAEAVRVKELYAALEDFDRKPLVYKSVLKNPSQGRFARSKHRSGHVGVDSIARCFISAGSPALPPSRSRVVEAICLQLLEVYPCPATEATYSGRRHSINRWHLILVAYNRIRARLFHSRELLSGTDLTLYNLNEKQISLWFENKTRREEVVTLLQGRSLPGATETANEPLPEPRKRQRIVSLAPPIELKEPEDRSGQANIRRRGVPKTVLPVSVPSTAAVAVAVPLDGQGLVPLVQPAPQVSRTTAWRNKDKAGAKKARKVYSCSVCHAPASQADHGHYYGQRYCPMRPGAPTKEQWLRQATLQRKENKRQKQL
eukprot:gene21122-23194_t